MEPNESHQPRRRRRWIGGGGLLVAVLVAVAVLLAACGGGSSPSASNSSTGGSTGGNGSTNGGVTVAFSQCMRSHGITNFPDPNSNGVISGAISDGVNPNSPQFQAAEKACQKYSSGGTQSAQQQAQASARGLKYAECMRSHGVTDFPDPSSNGAISGGGSSSASSGVNPNSPQYQAANKICQPIYTGGKAVKPTSGGS